MATLQTFPAYRTMYLQFKQVFEDFLDQTSPLNDKGFIQASSHAQTMIGQIMQREVGQNTKENFALTASLDTLINIFGVNYGIPYKAAQSTVLRITLPTTFDPSTITSLTNFTGPNGILYYNVASATSAAGLITLDVTARTAGVIGNLTPGQDTLEISRNFSGIDGTTATITEVVTTGTAAEDTEVYRQRILGFERAPGGGGNLADYRNWGEKTPGFIRIYPVSGLPWDDPLFPGTPIERTLYGEVSEDLNIDGIPTSGQLDELRDYVRFIYTLAVSTGLYQEPMGLTNYRFYTEPIRRTEFFTQVIGAIFQTGTEAQVKTEIDTAVSSYYKSKEPFTQGLDVDSNPKNKITSADISGTVNAILVSNGASAQSVIFGTSPGLFIPEYTLVNGEKSKNGGVSYASS